MFGWRRRGSRDVVTIAVLAAVMLTGGASRAQEATPAVDPASLSGRIVADGSSTVWPILVEASDRFTAVAPVEIEINVSGTGGGFERFCAGETDLQNASRPINEGERVACEAAGVEWAEIPLGYDGITVVVNPANTFAECLTVEQLQAIWRPDQPLTSWQELDPAWPAAPLDLYGPGGDSGTFDYFTETILGEAGLSRTDYGASEDDFYLVESVASLPDALGYFGYAYYAENSDRLRALAIDGGDGCVAPSPETIADGSYAPLSRPLYVYVNLASLSRPEVREFLRLTVEQSEDIVALVSYVPLPADEAAKSRDTLRELLSGADGT